MNKPCLIFTDLDGTLLDHHSYSFAPAVPILTQLKTANVAVIPNTSKTLAELVQFRQQSQLDTPFIVENGSAVFIPQSWYLQQPHDTQVFENFWVKSFTQPRSHWLSVLHSLPVELQDAYLGFSKMDNQTLCDQTGLSAPEALNANNRLYSEPVKWLGTATQKQHFIQLLTDAGANVLQGGRFLHISGHANKGDAMLWLTNQVIEQTQIQHTTIALGDSFNDNAMLEAADIAVQIKSHNHQFPILQRTKNTLQSSFYGPSGWAECLQQLFDFEQELHHG